MLAFAALSLDSFWATTMPAPVQGLHACGEVAALLA